MRKIVPDGPLVKGGEAPHKLDIKAVKNSFSRVPGGAVAVETQGG
jgi:hypothetical protein